MIFGSYMGFWILERSKKWPVQ